MTRHHAAASSPVILLVDDEADALVSMELTLKLAGLPNIQCCRSSSEAAELVRSSKIDLAVLDIIMPGMDGIELLRTIKETDGEVVVIMATGVNEVDTAVSCIKHGAFDYILKPIESERFVSSVFNALRMRELEKENHSLTEQLLSEGLKYPDAFQSVITRNERMMMIFKYIEAIAPTSHGVLITGETGVGKELIARAIHAVSGCEGEFVAVNVAEIDDGVFSDTLFGHAKGAFTGAETARKGLVEIAAGGTLFLDEIGDLSLQSQIKLLRLLQEHEYRSVGSDTPKHSDARIVTATCKSLEALHADASFRNDLYYRLRTHHVDIPPLRARMDDIELLATELIARAAIELKKPVPVVPRELFTLLKTYHFPGNIRELQAMIYDAMSVHAGGTLSLKTFKSIILGNLGVSDASPAQSTDSASTVNRVEFPMQLPTLKEVDEMLIDEALRRAEGNQSIAASLLGITRQALGQRMKKTRR